MATPARVSDELPEDTLRPVPGKLRLSPEAIGSRLRRVFTPNVKGEYKVSMEIVEQWRKRGKGRTSLEQLFQSCGFDRDWGLETTLSAYGLKTLMNLYITFIYL